MADGNQKQFVVLRKDLVNFLETVKMTDKDRLALARQRLRHAIRQHRYRRSKHYRPFESDGGEVSGESGSERSQSVRDSASDRTQESSDEGASLSKEDEDARILCQEVSESVSSLALNSEDPPPPPVLRPSDPEFVPDKLFAKIPVDEHGDPVEPFYWNDYKRAPDIFVLEPPKMPCDMAEFRTKTYIYQPSPMLQYRPPLQRAVTFKDVKEAENFLDSLNFDELSEQIESVLDS